MMVVVVTNAIIALFGCVNTCSTEIRKGSPSLLSILLLFSCYIAGSSVDAAWSSQVLIQQGASAAVAYFGLVAYSDRPRGRLAIDAFEIKTSTIPNAGMGLFVTQNIPKETVLGTYPGVLLPLETNIGKAQQYPRCEAYIWRFSDSKYILDPTDDRGCIQDLCYGGSNQTPLSNFFFKAIRLFATPTDLARINEPPLGGTSCNVYTSEDLESREVVFKSSRDLYAGEELFMDYGPFYDRSFYGS